MTSHKCPTCGRYVDREKGYYSPVNDVGSWELSLYCTYVCQQTREVRADLTQPPAKPAGTGAAK